MSAQLYTVPFQCVVVSGLAVPGATMTFYLTGTSTKTPTYTTSALSVQNPNPITANGAGAFTAIYLDSSITYRVVIKNAAGTTLQDTDPYTPGVTTLGITLTTATGSSVSTRAAVAAIASPVANQVAFLTESGREGMFVFDASNLATMVTADTAQGIYVAPESATTGASGAWVRQWSGSVDPLWWGITPSSSGAAAANSTARDAMIATLFARRYQTTDTYYAGLEPIQFDHRKYWFNDTWDMHSGTFALYGTGTGIPNSIGTTFQFPAGTDGFIFQYYSTSGETAGPVADHHFAQGSHVRGIRVDGGYAAGSAEGEHHAFVLRSPAKLEDCYAKYWQGDGYHIHAHSGGAGMLGNANSFQLYNCTAQNCRRGVSLAGADANAYTIIGGSLNDNRQAGLYEPDDASLGGLVLGTHFDANGRNFDYSLHTGAPPIVVSHGGNRYGVIFGQETGASTNAPKSSTVTITIASPGVVSWSAHGLVAGTPVAFSTTGALPTGLTANTTYYVVNPTTNDFQVAATSGGAAINTSGSQSGVHTSGVGLDNTWWYYIGVGGPLADYPTWVSGTTYRAGGAVICQSANAVTQFVGCYAEPPSLRQMRSPSWVLGGSLADSPNVGSGGSQSFETVDGFVFKKRTAVRTLDGPSTSKSFLGGTGALDSFLRHEASNGQSWTWSYSGGYLRLTDGGSVLIIGVNSTTGKIYQLDLEDAYRFNGTKVVGAQGAAVADATGAGDVVAQLNALLARLRTHGLIAT